MAGTSSAVVVHLALTVLGASAMLNFLAAGFEWLHWLGAAYLVWLGVAAWRAPAVVLDGVWAVLAARLSTLLMSHVRLRNRITGGLLVGAGVGLASARRP